MCATRPSCSSTPLLTPQTHPLQAPAPLPELLRAPPPPLQASARSSSSSSSSSSRARAALQRNDGDDDDKDAGGEARSSARRGTTSSSMRAVDDLPVPSSAPTPRLALPPPPPPVNAADDPQWPRWRARLLRALDSPRATCALLALTLFAILQEDCKYALLPARADVYVEAATAAAVAALLAEIGASSCAALPLRALGSARVDHRC